jgi:glycine dehydrogenase subunit 2
MYYGGSLGGFIATRDEEKFVMEYPSRLFGIARTSVEGEWGFGDVAYSRTSFDKREKGKEFIGTAAALYGVAAAVYLALMGPQGMRELGIHILQKARYAAMKLAEIPGATAPFAAGKRRIEQVQYSWEELTKETGVDTHQFSLRMADFGFHLWSSHHPFLVPQPFTIEPTESYSKEELDEYVDGLRHVAEEARREPETVKNAPHRSVVHKIDESTFDDPSKWAITWRAYRKKHGNPAAEGGTK